MKIFNGVKIAIFVLIILILGLVIYFFNQGSEIQPRLSENMDKKTKSEIPPEPIKKISLVTVYDNYLADSRLETGWGFSCLVKTEDKNILFDTGADSPILLSNMEKLGINPGEIDFVFISHLHEDHIGGLPGILEIKPDLPVYKPEFFSGPVKIENGIRTTGPLGDGIKEQSLIIESEKGLIIITGCAHPGIVNIITSVKSQFPDKQLYLVMGGFHLFQTSDFDIKKIIEEFKNLGVQKVAPCHCSGDRCRELFKQEYKDNFIENGAGKIIN